MLGKKSAQLGARAALLLTSAPAKSAAAIARAVAEWSEVVEGKGGMVYRDPMEERDAAYLKATSANGLIFEGLPLAQEADYLSEARVDYMYKGPCDSTSSLRLNSATQFVVENNGSSQPVSVHCATVGGHAPMAVNLSGTGLSHLHFKGSSSGLGCKFVTNNLIGTHPSRQLHWSTVARQQGVQDTAAGGTMRLEFAPAGPSNAQGIQGDADSAQARLWVSRCLGDGLHTDCALPPEAPGRQRRSVQQLFVQMLLDIRAAGEAQLKSRKPQ